MFLLVILSLSRNDLTFFKKTPELLALEFSVTIPETTWVTKFHLSADIIFTKGGSFLSHNIHQDLPWNPWSAISFRPHKYCWRRDSNNFLFRASYLHTEPFVENKPPFLREPRAHGQNLFSWTDLWDFTMPKLGLLRKKSLWNIPSFPASWYMEMTCNFLELLSQRVE